VLSEFHARIVPDGFKVDQWNWNRWAPRSRLGTGPTNRRQRVAERQLRGIEFWCRKARNGPSEPAVRG
jgi:hypothetical protein